MIQIKLPGYFKYLLILWSFIIPFHTTTVSAKIFSSENYKFYVNDQTGVGASIGFIVAIDDAESELTYSITSGNTNNTFSINASTGEFRLEKKLKYHSQMKYDLVVRAAKPGGDFGETSVNIFIYLGAVEATFNSINWTNAANQPVGTHEIHGTVVGGKLYIFGGYDVNKQPNNWTPTKRAYVYDPGTNAWSAIAELPHTPKGANFGGITHQGLATDGTDIYFAGGYPSTADGLGQVFGTKQVWRYNVATNNYSALPDLPEELAAGQLEYLMGKLHYMGGANKQRHDVAVHYVLDLDNLPAGWTAATSLPSPRNHPGSAVYEGKIYFFGGAHHQDQATVTQKRVDVYDPATNAWTRLADMPTARDHISSSVVVMGERIIVLGGETSHNVRSDLVSAYTPSLNTWSELTPLPVTIGAGVAAMLNGALHYTGGDFTRTNRKGTYSGSNSQPVVNITRPQSHDSFSLDSPILIEANATVNNGSVSKVEFYADETKIGEDLTSPYSFSWNTPEIGPHHIIARAINNHGAISNSASVFIQVFEQNIPPVINIVSPADGAKFLKGSEIIISAEASDEDGTIQKVEFFINDEKIGEDNTPPYQFSWSNVPQGQHTIKSRAFDNLGASTYSSEVHLEVLSPDSPPVFSIISPVQGSEYEAGDDILIEIEAWDPNNAIVKIELYNKTEKITDLNNTPYKYSWTNVLEGVYQLSAIAYTNDDEEIFSDTVEINVLPSVLTAVDDDLNFLSHFKVYPIPSSGKITIEFIPVNNEDLFVEIYNLQGLVLERLQFEKVQAGSLQNLELEGNNLSNGLYILKLNTSKNSYLKKLIIEK